MNIYRQSTKMGRISHHNFAYFDPSSRNRLNYSLSPKGFEKESKI